ncbi:MAG: anaerobic ribonucleoside-triphosphate reductase activating protein [Candidatus Coproplasma sp.]
MNYATIKWYDISNGPGVRVSLYVSGCRNHCKGCFNKETWDFTYGEPFTKEVEDKIIEAMKPDYISGFTLLGGDPFEPENSQVLAPFMKRLRAAYPEKSFWCFTGYDLDAELLSGKKGDLNDVMDILHTLDVLVDGRFVEEKKDLNLRFKGSSNQRTILVKPTLEKDEIVLWDGVTSV